MEITFRVCTVGSLLTLESNDTLSFGIHDSGHYLVHIFWGVLGFDACKKKKKSKENKWLTVMLVGLSHLMILDLVGSPTSFIFLMSQQ